MGERWGEFRNHASSLQRHSAAPDRLHCVFKGHCARMLPDLPSTEGPTRPGPCHPAEQPPPEHYSSHRHTGNIFRVRRLKLRGASPGFESPRRHSGCRNLMIPPTSGWLTEPDDPARKTATPCPPTRCHDRSLLADALSYRHHWCGPGKIGGTVVRVSADWTRETISRRAVLRNLYP